MPGSAGAVCGRPECQRAASADQAEHAAPESGPPVTGSLSAAERGWGIEGTESVMSDHPAASETDPCPGSGLALGLPVRWTGGH